MPKHIDNKDKGDNISKILADRLEETKQKLLNLSFGMLLTGTSQNKDKWYQYQMANLRAFKIKANKMIATEKKVVLKAVKQGSKEINLTSKQQKRLVNKVNTEMNNLFKIIIMTHNKNIASINSQAGVSKTNVVDDLYNTIRDKMLQTQDYGVVVYRNGRLVKWENYMEMKLRTDIQADISKNMVKDGAAMLDQFSSTYIFP